MAGICGMIGFVDKDLLKAMSRIIYHRGEYEVIFTDDTIGFIERSY